jgi:hypothetical protein
MWSVTQDTIPGGLRFRVLREWRVATFGEFLHALRDEPDFRAWWNALLASVPFAAYRWETPGVTVAGLAQPFEFVVLDAPDLEREPDADAFAEHFRSRGSAVAVWNLGGDALLVIPTPLVAHSAYPHLAAFVRNAPENQCDALWQLVAQSMFARVAIAPLWLSTAGAGVAWLHVRLDSRPKYYGHAAYREIAAV